MEVFLPLVACTDHVQVILVRVVRQANAHCEAAERCGSVLNDKLSSLSECVDS
jgi:hypothetical protein